MTAAAPAAGPRAWFDRSALQLAPELLGARLVHAGKDGTVGGRIVEVEAYAGPEDLAAHSARGRRTARTEVMFGPPGHLYVYLIYGIHHCLNVVAGPGSKPEAVLIRALAIDEGLPLARERRAGVPDRRLAAGPGNVARALGIDRAQNGIDLTSGPVLLEPRPGDAPDMRVGRRIGVDYAADWAELPMRFWIADDPHVSRR